MRPKLTRRAAPRRGGYSGPNWRGVGRVEVHAAGMASGTLMTVDFDCRSVATGGQFLVTVDGRPELLLFRRFTRGLRARIGGRWVDVARDDLRDMAVIGRLVEISRTIELSESVGRFAAPACATLQGN